MLSNVLDDYLGRAKEREFDLPLLLLLPALGFYDIQYTHGSTEFGTDFIAKKLEDGVEVQYSFQSKAGDIALSAWRKGVRGQLESAQWGSAHPNFDRSLAHQVVLITTGNLTNAASSEVRQFNDARREQYQMRPIQIWSKNHLLDLMLRYGLNGIHRSTAAGFGGFGQFFLTYSRAMQGVITVTEIELYSRLWSHPDVDPQRRLLLAAIESEVLIQECIGRNLVYEAIQLHLGRLRLLCEQAYEGDGHKLSDLWTQAVERLHEVCASYISRVREHWSSDKDLVNTWMGDLHMNTYPVQCARIMEIASLAYFTSNDAADRAQYATFLREFVEVEPGCGRPISDRFAITLVLGVLVLLDSGSAQLAAMLLEVTTTWLGERYENRLGLPGIEADEQVETNALLGSAFEFIKVPDRRESLLATALLDLAAFLGNGELYADIVNDIGAVRVRPEYWQPRDSVGAVRIEGSDVLYYPSVGFAEVLPPKDEAYAEHLADESFAFHFVQVFGAFAAVAIMTLLRDRYFPKLFPLLAPNYVPVSLEISTAETELS